MTSCMQNIKVGSHKNLLPFKNGIILNDTYLQEVLSYLKNQYNSNDFQVEYSSTNRIYQDKSDVIRIGIE